MREENALHKTLQLKHEKESFWPRTEKVSKINYWLKTKANDLALSDIRGNKCVG